MNIDIDYMFSGGFHYWPNKIHQATSYFIFPRSYRERLQANTPRGASRWDIINVYFGIV